MYKKKSPPSTPQKVNIHALKLTSYSTLRAVLEICDNAIEAAMSKGDNAEVKVSISGERVLTILDNGPGMTRDELEKSSALGGT
jgi:DNA gyrase/topoisomerase IV subunit B